MKIVFAHSAAVRAAGVMLALGLAVAGAKATSYNFESIQRPGASVTSIYDISNAGVAVGTALFESATEQVSRGFVVSRGVVTDFAGPQGAVSWSLSAISDSGVIVGNFSTRLEDDGTGSGLRVPGPVQTFSYSGGTFVTLATPPGFSVVGMSPNGHWVTGIGSDVEGKTVGMVLDMTLGSVTALDCAADFCVAAGVNNAGKVAGYSRTRVPTGGNAGIGWVHDLATGVRTDFAIAGSDRVALRDIDALGTVSGYFGDPRLERVQGFVDRGAGIELIEVPGATSTFVFGANDGGALVGEYRLDPLGPNIAFIARPVPEPASLGLVAAGLAFLGGNLAWRRTRRQRR